MTDDGSYLRCQFKTAWSLTDLHLTKSAAEIGYARFLYAVRR